MALKRATIVQTRLAPDVLTARMVGIGMNFAATPEPDADIEATLVEASIVGMDEHDFRALAVLTTWFGIHHTYVRADRLVRLVQVQESERVRAYWAPPSHGGRRKTAASPGGEAVPRLADRIASRGQRLPDQAEGRGRSVREIQGARHGRDAS